MEIREATHAGSWYSGDPIELKALLEKCLKEADKQPAKGLVKLLIGPHAGYSFCAKTAAWAYVNINPSKYSRVILMGPSHHAPINYCALSKFRTYQTPLGNIDLDTDILEKLSKISGFGFMSPSQDEEEHSLEMHIPFIKQMFGSHPFKLVPIMVGSITSVKEEYYGKVLADFMQDSETLFIASSDFCHWGSNFDYMYYKKEDGAIYQSIEKLDRRGMEAIQSNIPANFTKYLDETENTICGRHPISIALNAIKNSGQKFETTFTHYSQSNQVKSKSDFSVSYASAISTRLS